MKSLNKNIYMQLEKNTNDFSEELNESTEERLENLTPEEYERYSACHPLCENYGLPMPHRPHRPLYPIEVC